MELFHRLYDKTSVHPNVCLLWQEMNVVYGVGKVCMLCGMYMGFKILNTRGKSGGNAHRCRQCFPQKHNSYAQALHVIELCGQVK